MKVFYMKDRVSRGDCIDSKLVCTEVWAQTVRGAVKRLKRQWRTSRQSIVKVVDGCMEFHPDDLPDF
jgi:hypothetical protein